MNYHRFGRTGLEVSALGFGCGATGGLLVKGNYREMVPVVARAIDAGINYFDTARIYGDGASEANLGLVLEELKPDVIVGTKIQLQPEQMDDIPGAIVTSLEASLKSLRRDSLDLLQLHNFIAFARRPERRWINVDDVYTAIRVFQKLQQQGKIRYWGINGMGETTALHKVVATVEAGTIQCCFNLINPSAGVPVPAGFPFQDYEQLVDKAAARDMGVIAIRVLAGGALSGSGTRHPNASQAVDPIATGSTYAEDVVLAQRFNFLVEEGYAGSLVEAAMRFVTGKAEVATTLIGFSNMVQLEQAIAFAAHDSLPNEALNRLSAIWANYQDLSTD